MHDQNAHVQVSKNTVHVHVNINDHKISVLYMQVQNLRRQKGYIDLDQVDDVYPTEAGGHKRHCTFAIRTAHRNFVCSAPSVAAMRVWVDALLVVKRWLEFDTLL